MNQSLFGTASRKLLLGTAGCLAILLLGTTAAWAHHPLGGQLPSNWLEGFLSGLGHPVLGLDHLAFVASVGLLAASVGGAVLPVIFAVAAMAGTGIHLAGLDLPAPEFFISGSVLLFGIFLALRNCPQLSVLAGLTGFMGLFHGYAYGEAIFGAEMTPLVAYLAGFTCVQLGIAIAAFGVGKILLKPASLRFAGFTVCGFGAAFLSTLLLETVFPG